MALSNWAIIVIVIVCCLAAISLGAALTRQLYPAEERQYHPSHDQNRYMRSVRMKNLRIFHREGTSLPGKDVESQYTTDEVTSSRG